MVTPLMLLLSSINERYEYDKPVDIMHLNRSDRSMIIHEAERLGSMAQDDSQILMTTDCFGNPMADTAQVVDDKVIEISRVTAMMLTRLGEAYSVYQRAHGTTTTEVEDSDDDLGTDAVILRLEGNPKYVYIYVYNIMTSRGLSFDAKMHKLLELYTAIIGHVGISLDDGKAQQTVSRFELQSTIQFWQGLLISDMLRHGITGETVTASDIEVLKRELASLGFYGFVNPYKMYLDFSGSRVNRKVGVNIAQEVIIFLEKVVRSGGIV